jgi:hypothetical protein
MTCRPIFPASREWQLAGDQFSAWRQRRLPVQCVAIRVAFRPISCSNLRLRSLFL